jgi:O-antigen ligase
MKKIHPLMKKDWLINTTIFVAPLFSLGLSRGGMGEPIFFLFYAYLAAICVSAFLRILNHEIDFKESKPTLGWLLVFMLVSFASFFWSIDLTRWLIAMVQLVALGSLFILAFDKRGVTPSFIAFIPILFITIVLGAIGVLFPDVALNIYENSNALGVAMFTNIFFLLWGWRAINNKIFRILASIAIVSGIWLVILSQTRSALLCLFFALAAYLLLKIKNRAIPILIIYGLFIGSFIFILYYIAYSKIDDPVEVASGAKAMFTGRQFIWAGVLSAIYDSPLIGYGAGLDIIGLADKNEYGYYFGGSAHNHNLQLLFQIGLVGFIPFFLFVKNLFYALIKNQDSLLGASFLIGVMVQQNFEVLLTQNNLILGIPIWVSIIASYKSNYNLQVNPRRSKPHFYALVSK